MPNFGFDNWMDAQLRNVPVPPDLLSRLAQTGAADAPNGADQRLDAVLRNVSVPADLEIRLLRIARQPRPRPLLVRLAMAASVLLVLGLGAAGYVALTGGALGPAEPMFATTAEGSARATDATVVPTPKNSPQPLAKVTPAALVAKPATGDDDRGAQTKQTKPSTADSRLPDSVATLSATLKEAVEAHRRSQTALGAGGDFARLPALDAWEGPQARGHLPPIVPGYDLLFQLKHGEHPFVAPVAHKSLETSHVPLTFRTASYDLAMRGLAGATLPSADEIRVEEFLAAQRYALPATEAGDVALHAAASPSPLGRKGLYLVQLAVQAGPQSEASHPPTRLVVVVDTSAAMLSGARWEAVLRGLEKVAAQMTSDDRLTLIGFAEQSRVLAENTTATELRTLLGAGKLPGPEGSADLPAAIRAAAQAMRSVAAQDARRVVFITSGRGEFDDAAVKRSGQDLALLSGAKVPWQIVRMASGEDEGQWNELAQRGHGEVSRAASPNEVHQALARKLTGRFATVAGGATLKLRFNPEFVTSYRLVGHESVTVTGTSDRLEIDLAADDVATGMFEMWIKPEGDQLAIAELSWRDPATGQPHGKVQPIWRSHFAASFSEAPGWFQQGVIAAKTAEALRGSFYLTGSRPLAQVIELAGKANAEVADRPDFKALLELARHADKRR